MQFVIIGLDGKDDDAPSRRQAARPKHLALGAELVAKGNLLWGSALLDEDGNMEGSLYVVNFSDRAELDAYMAREPYMLGDVWQDVTIRSSNVNNPVQFSRSEEWFEANL